MRILDQVSKEVREVYNILEVDFHPLELSSRITPLLDSMEKASIGRFVKALRRLSVIRLLDQVCVCFAFISSFFHRTFGQLPDSLFQKKIKKNKNEFFQISDVYRNIKMSELLKLAPLSSSVELDNLLISLPHLKGSMKIDHQNGLVFFDLDGLQTVRMREQLTNLTSKFTEVTNLIHPQKKVRRKKFYPFVESFYSVF
jgi:hypothetical protein